jgi:branched-chain amino acid transport system permease protein
MAAQVTLPKNSTLRSFLRDQWLALAVLAVFVLFPFVFALLTGNAVEAGPTKFWMGQLIAFFIMAVYAMSYDILMGYTGILSFGQAAFFGGGAYAMAIFLKHIAPALTQNYRISFPGLGDITDAVVMLAAFILVVAVSVLLGLLFSATSARVKGVYFAMITLAIADALYILSRATDFVKWTGADEGLHGVPLPAWLNPTNNRLLFYFICLGFLVLSYLALRRIVHSPTGRVLVALRENDNRVRMIGYNPTVYRTLAFVISAVAAGLAGGMFSLWNASATPSMTSALTTINALIMTILGGIGTLVGPILGAGLMQIFGQFFFEWFGPRWPLVFGIVFIGLVMFLPYGIVGTWRLRRANVREGWRRLVGLVKK